MKLQYKYSLITFSLGAAILFIVLFFIYLQNTTSARHLAMLRMNEINHEIEKRFETELNNLISSATSIALTPKIISELRRSNRSFAEYDSDSRIEQINKLNKRWKNTNGPHDPFVRPYLQNPIVDYLKAQQSSFPGRYGEIFITNRYGVAIATTAKLTTLAHAQKYWWLGSFYNGKGRVFFDDRGFDASAKGYVLGTVVPIYDNGEIIGILKCNVNITGPLSDIFDTHKDFDRDGGFLQLVRSGGKVIYQAGVKPLSVDVSTPIINAMQQIQESSVYQKTSNIETLTTLSPVNLTKGSDLVGFGGSYESIDHILGNNGEIWFVAMTHNVSDLVAVATKTFRHYILISLGLTVVMALIALLLGHKISKPIVSLARWADDISESDLHTFSGIKSNDEIGLLTASFNRMVDRLKETMTSRDNLTYEIQVRRQAEQKSHRLTQELKDAQAMMLHREKMASIGQLAAGVAHEINNPIGFVTSNLTSMKKYAARLQEYAATLDDLLDENTDPEVNKTYQVLRKKLKINQVLEDMPDLIDESIDGVERVSVIVKNLKTFSRVNDNETKQACINECLASTLKMVSNELKYKADIQEEYGEISEIECSPGELNQVFMNLLVNAGHAIEEKGQITIKTWQEGTNIHIQITDTGQGIDPEFLSHIFEPFYTTKEVGKGTGLGLSISHGIVKQHNGNITVESTTGEGTSFTITLPIA